MEISRRSFLGGAACLGFSGCVSMDLCGGKRPNLKFGVLSDIHITDWASTEIFRKTLRYFRSQGVDAVMIAGDMADHGLLPQLENVAKAWYEVFPDDKDEFGNHVEKLFVYGNHDPEGLAYRDPAMDKAFKAMNLTYEEADKLQLRNLGMDKCWEKCFHEAYSPIYIKNVKGYDFIGGHWDTWQGIRGLEDWWKANISKVDTSQPFFYFQHCTPRNTIFGADSWGDDDGQSVRCLAKYCNAVAFSGHSHRPLTDGRNYWRGEFTSIGTSTLSYVCLPEKGRENKPSYRDKLDCRQGQIVNVFDDHLAIERRDFVNDEALGGTVVVPMPTKVSTFSVRGALKSAIPEFSEKTKAEVVKGEKAFEITFTGAFANKSARPYEYSVQMHGILKDGKEKWTRPTRWFQADVCFNRKRAAAKKNVFRIPLSELPENVGKVRFIIIPMNCYGGKGYGLDTGFINV